ncbi:hypothetical protein BDR06DRAFT_950736, partial [Suillus hirtellus]
LHRLRNWWVSGLGVRGRRGGDAALSSDELEDEKEERELLKNQSRDGRGASESVLARGSLISFWELQMRSGGHLRLMRRKVGGESIIGGGIVGRQEYEIKKFQTLDPYQIARRYSAGIVDIMWSNIGLLGGF